MTNNSNKILDYTNCIIVAMQNYIIDKIIENNLSWNNPQYDLVRDREEI